MISLWFPKAIYFQPNILNNKLGTYEKQIKGAFSSIGTCRERLKNVDSTHRLEKNIFDVAELDGLVDEFYRHANLYLDALGYKKRESLHIQNCWANISYPGDYLFPHNHGGSVIAGVYYVKCGIHEKIKFLIVLQCFLTQMNGMKKIINIVNIHVYLARFYCLQVI